MTQYYRVAEHIFAIEATEQQFALLPNYAPFLQSSIVQSSILFTLHVQDAPIPSIDSWEHVYTDRSEETMPRIEMYKGTEEWLFRIAMTRDGEVVCAIRCSSDWKEVQVSLLPDLERFAIDNAAMFVYAIATLPHRSLLFHSSVTVHEGKAYMFLGHSGTGKSTHSQQWHAAFADAELLNDDNPIVRILEDGSVRVYGSPWSGKTPCYKNASAPLQALVQLAQAPHNEISKLKMTQAYPYILASVWGIKLLPQMMDVLYASIAQLLELIPVFRLECLPNPDAALLCAQTCSPSSGRTDSSL